MLWPVVVPFQITACVLLVVLTIATLVAPMLKWKRLHVFLTVGVLCLICFLPLCGAIMRSMDAKRFGVFDYESFADVQDFRVAQLFDDLFG